ncbi:MAG: ABC transporter permease [Truepera sp.]|nr:ABC transporter permease [Truepera sp.]MDE0098310.1 ABC transporter permease [Truepera sp.]
MAPATPATKRLRPWWNSRFLKAVRNNPFSVLGIVIILAFFVFAIYPQGFTRYDPELLSLRTRLLPPSSEHWLGTDQYGMDVFTRVIYGARTTLYIVVVVLAIATGIGFVVGTVAGYFGGVVDEILMRFTDIIIAFPFLILAIAVNAALGRGLLQTMLAVGFSWWPGYARLVRGQILAVKNEEYVTAARALGGSNLRIMARHVFRNSVDPIIVRVTLDIGLVALATSGLSFLGLGAAPPTPEWGRMVADGRDFLLDQWWISTYPGLALFLVVVGFNLVGMILRDWLDPSSVGR